MARPTTRDGSSDMRERRSISSEVNNKDQRAPPQRISSWLRFLIVLCLSILVTSIVFLSWLWYAPHTDDWRRVIASKYSTQSVTIAAMLLRSAVATLAGIATSMIASIAIESRRGVPLEDVAQVSINRVANGGPLSLFNLLFGPVFDWPLRIATALLILTTLAAQFSSTLLVTDLTNGYTMGFSNEEPNTYGLARSLTASDPRAIEGISPNFWDRRPSSSEMFAEYTEPVDNEDTSVDDTGVTVRALLPYTMQSRREQLRTFEGMARVLDARVVCARPEIKDLKVAVVNGTGNTTTAKQITGTVTLKRKSSALDSVWGNMTDRNEATSSFSCPILAPKRLPYSWMLCRMNWDLALNTTLSNATNRAPSQGFGIDSYLVWNTWSFSNRLHLDGVKPIQEVIDTIQGDNWELQNSTDAGPWLEQELGVPLQGDKTAKVTMRSSVCFESFAATKYVVNHLNVTITNKQVQSEPTYSWNNTRERYEISDVVTQLGARKNWTTETNSKRKIMNITTSAMMDSLKDIKGKPIQLPYDDRLYWMEARTRIAPYTSVAFCPVCEVDQKITLTTDMIYANMMDDIVSDTDSPALAIQAIKTVLARVVYYDLFNSFSPGPNPAKVSRFIQTQNPQSSRGYASVMSIIFANMILFLFISFRFRKTRLSILDNEWHAVAQVAQSPEIREILPQATVARDDEVEGWLRDRHSLANSAQQQQQPQKAVKWKFWGGGGASDKRTTARFGVDNDGCIRTRQVGDVPLTVLRRRAPYEGVASEEALTDGSHT